MPFDTLIIGGNIVGAATALSLARLTNPAPLRIALVDQHRPAPYAPGGAYDQRVYSLTPSVRAWLEELGIWQTLPRERIAPVPGMKVWGDAGGYIEFDALENGADALAYIVEQTPLLHALWAALQAQSNVSVIAPAQVQDLAWSLDDVELSLQEAGVSTRHTAKLVVGADGADSWTRAESGIETVERAYPQRAIVANCIAERAHGGTAYQWFGPEGVLAWLPLPDGGEANARGAQISIVWSANESVAQELLSLSDEDFCGRLAQAGGERLGALRLASPRASFPLRYVRAQSLVRARVALVGDAAHCIHPLAGQGVNLGLEDAACLAQTIAERGMQRDCGDFHLLRRYERARKEDVLLMQGATDGLQRLFGSDAGWLRRARNSGLTAVGRSGWLKRRLARHAMG
jgi:2-polyprenylphenol 6-hydroxylase